MSSAVPRAVRCAATARFALIGHLDSWEKTAAVVRTLRGEIGRPISVRDVREIVPFLPPRTVCRVTVFSTDGSGSCAHGVYVDAFLSPDRLGDAAGSVREKVQRIREAADCARRESAAVAALGGFSSIVLEGSVDLLPFHEEVAFTTGNTLTVAYIVKAIERASALAGRPLDSQSIFILGATGDVGSGCARYLIGRAGRLLLCARNPNRLRKLQRALTSASPSAGTTISISTDPEELLPEADFIVAAASLAAPRFSLRSVRPNAIVCDAGYPKNVLAEDYGSPGPRPRPIVFFGGMGQVLGGLRLVPDLLPVLAPHPAPNVVQGCLLEGMLLALEGRCESYSRGRGNISPAQVDEIWALAGKHGFALAPFFNDEGLCGDRIAALTPAGRRVIG